MQLAIAIIVLLTIFSFCLLITNSSLYSTLVALTGTFLLSIITMVTEDDKIINGVFPMWKFISYPYDLQYFSLAGDNTVVDSVRFYKIQKSQDITFVNGSSNKDFPKITITPNAVLVSNTKYKVTLPSPTANISHQASIEGLIIICANTIYGDRTFFFEGANLKGAFTLGKHNKVKAYSGVWSNCNKERAIAYLKAISECK
ncbi:hypothetical protein [Lactiplantibacillus pentosus]|uniref:hypothetical protein n=1 Tax=Lactiplantibacillus pentosus TaxID=1589 RepID=UPI003C23843D